LLIYLAVTPEALPSASVYHNRFAHVAYRIGPECRLLRQNLLLKTRGGLLSLSDRDCPSLSAPERLCRQLQQECAGRNFSGVLADFEDSPTPDRTAFLSMLLRVLTGDRRALYLPEVYAERIPGSVAVICTALSGGDYRQRLEEAAERFDQFALDVQRLCMDFSVPAPDGEGVPLSAADFRRLQEELNPAVYFSEALCARYFTYTREGRGHFVLFDDADTIRQKLRLGRAIGCSAAFLMYPEVKELLPELFHRSSPPHSC